MCYDFIEKVQNIDVRSYLEPIKNRKERVLNAAKIPIIDELLEPMQKQLDELKKTLGIRNLKS